jgi:SAM-dependent methyltransferase
VIAHDAEIARIRSVYSHRERELPVDLYGWNRPANLFSHCQILRSCVRMLVRHEMFPLNARLVVDIGCGHGRWLAQFLQWGADGSSLYGIDLNEARIKQAQKSIGLANLRIGDASRLPWADGAFDLVTQFTLFTSILDIKVKREIATEMLRVLKPDGLILWYDFRYNNPRNPNVRGIESKEIRSLFPDCTVTLEKVTLAPPVARRVVSVSWLAALMLEKVPFLRTHYLGVIKKQY